MRDGKKVIVTRKIEQNRELYKSFFDHKWATRLAATAPPPLQDAVDNLGLAWKEAANTHSMPWLMNLQVEGFANSLLSTKKPEVSAYMERVYAWVKQEVGVALNREKKKKLVELTKTFDQGLRIGKKAPKVRFPAQEHWDQIIQLSEIQLSISGSQGLAYCGVVFAYEWFVVSCYRVLGGAEKYRPNEPRFWADWQAKFGRDGQSDYWDDTPVAIARLARNCIAHTGGKVKPELMEKNPAFFVSEQGVISIQPSDNHTLFGVLKVKVENLLAEAAKKLAERNPLAK